MPALDRAMVRHDLAAGLGPLNPPPRILLLYGSLRARSFSRLAVEAAARLLILFGAEVRIFDPIDLPLPDQVEGDDHPAVHALREHALWPEARSEERRVGEECVSPCTSLWSLHHYNQKTITDYSQHHYTCSPCTSRK